MWIMMAWQCISPQVIVKGFKKCCISNAVDGNDDNMLWNGTGEDGNVRSSSSVGPVAKPQMYCSLLAYCTHPIPPACLDVPTFTTR